jgi:CRISPR-associated protein Cmr1
MKTITATFTITTPMFLGDAHQQSTSMRPPSIKGALRFWWRALKWKDVFDDGKDPVKALRQLHADEARIFGAATADNAGGQGVFLLSVAHCEISKSTFVPQKGHQYLLGQGLLRDSLNSGTFTLKVLFKPESVAPDQQSLVNVILLWGLLGGLGSRARKGFGSVAIQSIETEGLDVDDPKIPRNANELNDSLNELIGNSVDGLPPFTAFSKLTRIDISKTGDNALRLLDDIGKEMQMYRSFGSLDSFGRNKQVNGQPAEQNFGPGKKYNDHDLAQAAASGSKVDIHPARVAFGLPHNYIFSSTKSKLDIEPDGNGRNRRASPLFIHIHQFSDGSCCAIQTFFPALFLPGNDTIALKGKGRPQHFSPDIHWDVITDYLDRFTTNSDYRQVIP